MNTTDNLTQYLDANELSANSRAIDGALSEYLGADSGVPSVTTLSTIPHFHLRNRVYRASFDFAMCSFGGESVLGEHAPTCIAILMGFKHIDDLISHLEHPFPFPFSRDQKHLSSLKEYFGVWPMTAALFGIGYNDGVHLLINDERTYHDVVAEQLHHADLGDSIILLVSGPVPSLPSFDVQSKQRLNGINDVNAGRSGGYLSISVSEYSTLKAALNGRSGSIILGPCVKHSDRLKFINMLVSGDLGRLNLVVSEYAHDAQTTDYCDYRVVMGAGELPEPMMMKTMPMEREHLQTFFNTPFDRTHLKYAIDVEGAYPVFQYHPRDEKVEKYVF